MDLADTIKQEMENKSQPIIKRYMIEIKTYPNGTEFIKAWLVGKQNLVKKTPKPKKELGTVNVEQEEVY